MYGVKVRNGEAATRGKGEGYYVLSLIGVCTRGEKEGRKED